MMAIWTGYFVDGDEKHATVAYIGLVFMSCYFEYERRNT
jgi:hypothetical protein